MSVKKEYQVKLIEKEMLGEGNVLLTFLCPEIAETAVPGQFVNLSAGLFLKRPFGVAQTNQEKGTFSVGVRCVGEGTRLILESEIGDVFEVLGPLGQGFSWDGVRKVLFVGGGTGIFPVHFAQQFAAVKGIPAACVLGFRGASDAFWVDECEGLAEKSVFTTDNGDFGVHGNVLTGLATLRDEELLDTAVFCVGPEVMMKHVSRWALDRGLSCQVSMEKRMACGIGICLVCVCKAKAKMKAEAGGEDYHHVRCCKEGPVMNAEDVIW